MQNSITKPLTADERAGLPSASYWARYEQCAASYSLAKEAKRLGKTAWVDDKAAAAGSRIHSVLEGKDVPNLTESELYAIKSYSDKSSGEISRIFGDGSPAVIREKRFWLRVGGVPVASGRADLVALSGKVALIQDFKTGFTKPVDADSSAQLKFLAVALALENPDLEEIIGQIISPYGVSEARFQYSDLAEIWNGIVETVQAINDPMAEAVPSVEACRYCPAITICDAARKKAWKVTKYQINDLPTGERAGQILDECELVDRLVTAVREYYYQQLDNGGEDIPNWNLVPGRSVRELTNAQEAATKLFEAGIEGSAITALANYSVPELEKLVSKHFGLKATQAKNKLIEILGETLTTKQNKPVLKRTKELTKELSV